MKKQLTIVGILSLIAAMPLGIFASRYDFPKPEQKQYIIKELEKRLKIIDSNLTFDGKILTITLPGAKGDRGNTGQAGKIGRDGKNGKNGLSITGPIGPIPRHRWEGTQLSFETFNGWGNTVDLRGLQGNPGKKGSPGIDGLDGRDGRQGEPGIDGTNGINGSMGPQGAQGESGTPGRDGQNGGDGKRGPPGQNGKNGEDAIMPKFTTITVVTGVKLAENGKLVVSTQQVQIYLQ